MWRLSAGSADHEGLNLADAFDLAEFNFEVVYDAVFVFGKLDLHEQGDEAKCYGFFAISHDFGAFWHEGLDFCFVGGEVFDYVFGEDFVGYNYVAHAFTPLLWSGEAAFGAFVWSTEFAAFTVAFDLDFAAVGAGEFCGFCSWRDGFSATCAGD